MLEGSSDEKRCQNIVKAGSIEIVRQHHQYILHIFILYIVTQSDIPEQNLDMPEIGYVVVFWVPGG